MNLHAHLGTGLAGLFLLSAFPLPGQQPSPAPVQREEQERPFGIVRRVDRVTTPLVVRDRSGEYIDDLTRGEIQVFDNGVRQEITNFEFPEQPLSVVILLDTSLRIKPLLKRVQKSAIVFTESIIGPFGEAAVIAFDDDVRLLQDFTPDHEKIIQIVGTIQSEGSLTRLADAFSLGVERLLARPQGRRLVMVAVTEARDEGSETNFGNALRLAQLGEISVYTVELSKLDADLHRKPGETPAKRSPYPPGVMTQPPLPGSIQTPSTAAQGRQGADILGGILALLRAAKGAVNESVLETYSSGTAALHYSAKNQAALDNALYDIGQDIRSQYLVTYRPTNGTQQGFHKIEIKVTRERTKVRFRPGYYIGVPPSS